MCLAVADVEDAAGGKDAVRSGQRALQRIRLRTVTATAGAEHRRDDAAAEVDSSNDVVFGVRHVDAAAGAGQPFWTGQRRARAGAAVTGVALLARARDVANATAVAIDPNNKNHVIASQNDYRRGDGNCYGAYSLDGGHHWNDTTIPMGFTRGDTLPAGLQFFGRPWSEATLIRLAYAYEQATHHRRPPVLR